MALASAAIFTHLCIKVGLRICLEIAPASRRLRHPEHVIAQKEKCPAMALGPCGTSGTLDTKGVGGQLFRRANVSGPHGAVNEGCGRIS